MVCRCPAESISRIPASSPASVFDSRVAGTASLWVHHERVPSLAQWGTALESATDGRGVVPVWRRDLWNYADGSYEWHYQFYQDFTVHMGGHSATPVNGRQLRDRREPVAGRVMVRLPSTVGSESPRARPRTRRSADHA